MIHPLVWLLVVSNDHIFYQAALQHILPLEIVFCQIGIFHLATASKQTNWETIARGQECHQVFGWKYDCSMDLWVPLRGYRRLKCTLILIQRKLRSTSILPYIQHIWKWVWSYVSLTTSLLCRLFEYVASTGFGYICITYLFVKWLDWTDQLLSASPLYCSHSSCCGKYLFLLYAIIAFSYLHFILQLAFFRFKHFESFFHF